MRFSVVPECDLIKRLLETLPPDALIYGRDLVGLTIGFPDARPCPTRAIVRPRSTRQVADAVRVCADLGIPMVPMGGATGLVNGLETSGTAVLFDLTRMSRVEEIDADQDIAVVQAGATLQSVQETLASHGLAFPVDLGARGSATIGGMISTNAGGNRVIRYGMMRENVLGLEVVLPDGRVMCSMNRMLKNNAGYDLKHLFIGSEGTLGIVTRACLRLRSVSRRSGTALLCAENFSAVIALLRHLRLAFGSALSAFEVMWPNFYEAAASGTAPLAVRESFYVLVEVHRDGADLDEDVLGQCLSATIDAGKVSDGILAKSTAEAQTIWAIRDNVDRLTQRGPVIMFDVSVPISRMESYCARIQSEFQALWPDRPIYIWGHLADSNLHVWASLGDQDEGTRHNAERIVYNALEPVGGSISGEHGIGMEKRAYLSISRTPVEIELMHQLKRCLDPSGLLNPGKVLQVPDGDSHVPQNN